MNLTATSSASTRRTVCACFLLAHLCAASDLQPERTIHWGSPGTTIPIPTHAGNQFGYSLAPLGTDRFLVGIPLRGVGSGLGAPTSVGEVNLYSTASSSWVTVPHPSPASENLFGYSIASAGAGFAVSAPTRTVNAPGGPFAQAGTVYFYDTSATFLRAIDNPEPGDNESFGSTLAGLGADRILIGTASDLNGSGSVYIYSFAGTRLATLRNPTPANSDFFGFALAAVGPGRFVVGAHADDTTASNAGQAYLYDQSGAILRTHAPPGLAAGDQFGLATAGVGTNSYLVGAPGAEITTITSGGSEVVIDAGRVYLFDDNGDLLRSVDHPDPQTGDRFGERIAAVGKDRFLVSASRRILSGQSSAGAAYLFNLQGDLLATLYNPTPGIGDRFGRDITGVGEDRFVIAAPFDDTNQHNSGSAYVYHAPILEHILGREIPKPDTLNLNLLPPTGPDIEPPGMAYWHPATQRLYAVQPGSLLVRWRQIDNPDIVPDINVMAFNVWPTDPADYQFHVALSPPVDLTGGGTFAHAQLLAQDNTVGTDPAQVQAAQRFHATGIGRSLLLLAPANPTASPIFFQAIRTVAWNDSAHLHDHAPAIVGTEITATFGYHDAPCGSPFVYWPNSFYCADSGFYDRTRRAGPIIPVNTDKPGEANDLVLVFYQQGPKLANGEGAFVASSICWPWKPVRYDPVWPDETPHKIVIASQQGTGAVDPLLFKDWDLYTQNDPNLPGFNPNDEHALRRPYAAGEAIFALRDDLATPDTSEPYVLMKYLDASNLDRPQIRAFRVIAEEAPYFFNYPGTAGTLLQPPFPLSTLQLCSESTGVSGPYWRDRKQDFWARAAGDDGGPARIVMRHHYPVQPGFYFPGGPPPLGICVPWLDLRAGTPGVPIDVEYMIEWPDAPELRARETLVKPKFGLPDIASQTSVEVIYEQSVALDQGRGVRLIDPTRGHSVPLAQLPADIPTVTEGGQVYFPTLPPSLRNRLSYDPLNERLKFRGEFVEPPAGEYYLLLNVISPRERALILALSPNPVFQSAVLALAALAAAAVEVPPDAAAFDSLALTAGFASAAGYVTLAFANNPDLSPVAEPVVLQIIRVACPLYRGEVKAIESANPFDEQLTLRHSGDFAGETASFQFEWRTLPPVDGLPPTQPPEMWSAFSPVPASGIGAVDITIAGPGLQTLSDNYFICRYQRVAPGGVCGGGWSDWTPPQLAEGWIKRVLRGINPFEQRIQSYRDHQVNTIVSMISQAGARWAGSVPLNQAAADQFGLIEIYETVLQRGRELSIDGTPAVNYPPANDALLLAAGRIADLYMLLGNEAYADAADPTIAFGTSHGVYGAEAPSIHCFMNQTASLLEEELGLLRGRDDRLLPGVLNHPFYNRLVWNFTSDINGGEVAYALNYNIREVNGDIAGAIDEADARLMYPQGHGDAWGHYLTAIKNYYRLLLNPNFTWVPRIEAVLVGGVPVSVDYLDERKFARAAAARARTGAEIVNLTYRNRYVENPQGQYQGYRDDDSNRAWGLAEWGSRAGQGAYLDWAVANAILPAIDTHPGHVGIQKVDRTSVGELRDILSAFQDVQTQVDNSDAGLNPLGLAKNVLPFDIDPAQIVAGKTHFEQIYERAIRTLNNTIAVFNHANNSTQLLRQQADDVGAFQLGAMEREADFNNRLIEVFGYPYADDIGPAGAYPAGYQGPDLYHYDYVDPSELSGVVPPPTQTLEVTVKELQVGAEGQLEESTRVVPFHVGGAGFGLVKPTSWTGQRRAPGEIQFARSEFLQTLARFRQTLANYDNLLARIADEAELLEARHQLHADNILLLSEADQTVRDLNSTILSARSEQQFLQSSLALHQVITSASLEALPKQVGVSYDAFSAVRAAIVLISGVINVSLQEGVNTREMAQLRAQLAKEANQSLTQVQITTLQQEFAELQALRQLEQIVRELAGQQLEIFALREALQQASGRYLAALARGQRLLEDRLRFRRQTAAQVQGYRYKDMAFRIFRNDALQKYRAQFDLAARYVFLAARAYDYETNLRPGDPRGPGEDFLTQIVRARAIGLIQNGLPQTGTGRGDAGLADPLARLFQNWDLVLKGQLGFNNPQTETGRFSLRSELFRIQGGNAGNATWRETLARHIVPNLLDLPEFRRFCIPFTPQQPVEPAIVIPFSTTVNFGLNFFGWPAGGGDNDYDSTHFATKIRTVGVWFANYNNLGGGMINTPRIYLIPVGNDVLRSPTALSGEIREWKILDQALPVPFPLSGGALGNANWIPSNDTLIGQLGELRRYARFRAYHDSGSFNPAETVTDTRLVGRSVWNSRWLLIIPAGTLHGDRQEGLDRFIHGALFNDVRDGNGVSDIKLFFQTYAYAGN